jgi:2,3-bisphosphoglycerate-independent phosphoglycerate mutase
MLIPKREETASTTKPIIDASTISIDLGDDLLRQFTEYSQKEGRSVEDRAVSLIRTGIMSEDQSGAEKISESDPDNQTSEASRERSREKTDNMKLESEKFQDRLSRSSAIQNAFLVNDVEKAKGLQKIDAAITKSEDKKQTSQDEYPLVSSVVKFGTAYFDQINGR